MGFGDTIIPTWIDLERLINLDPKRHPWLHDFDLTAGLAQQTTHMP